MMYNAYLIRKNQLEEGVDQWEIKDERIPFSESLLCFGGTDHGGKSSLPP